MCCHFRPSAPAWLSTNHTGYSYIEITPHKALQQLQHFNTNKSWRKISLVNPFFFCTVMHWDTKVRKVT